MFILDRLGINWEVAEWREVRIIILELIGGRHVADNGA